MGITVRRFTSLAAAALFASALAGCGGSRTAPIRDARLPESLGTNLATCGSVRNRIHCISDRSSRENVWSVHVDPLKPASEAAADADPGAPKELMNSKNSDFQPPIAVGSVDLC